MPDSKQAIKDVYDAGIAEVFKVVGSLDATPAQRKVAKQTAKDLSSMLVTHTLQTIEGRTALLAGLIVELNQVIQAVEPSPPYQNAVEGFSKILTKAQSLFTQEKKDMI